MLKLSPKIIFLISSFVLLTNQSVGGAKLKCEYSTGSGWWGLDGTTYYCNVKDNGIFTDARVRIDSAEGVHAGGKTNKNVDGFLLQSSIPSVKFFPKNLENIFGDLIFICIYNTNLQEVKQDDLKVFPKLRCLQLYNNKITTIDANLFEFNPELTGILLHNNQISHIDPKVFDHLNNLHTLYLSANRCKNDFTNVKQNKPEVLKLIQRVRNAECSSDDVLQRQKVAQEEANKKAELERTKYEACQNLSSVISEKSELAKQVSEMKETERINQEKVKTCETSTADLNKNLIELREQVQKLQKKIQQQKNEKAETQVTVQELTATNEKQAKELKDLMELQGKLIENDLSNGVKMNDFRVKYETILQSKLELYDKHTSLNEKYTSLLHAKLIESEKVNEIHTHCMILNYGDDQQPIILVN